MGTAVLAVMIEEIVAVLIEEIVGMEIEVTIEEIVAVLIEEIVDMEIVEVGQVMTEEMIVVGEVVALMTLQGNQKPTLILIFCSTKLFGLSLTCKCDNKEYVFNK